MKDDFMAYGLNYEGSKNSIAEKIIELFPDATYFYDLFAGGCSMSHVSMSSGKFDFVVCNDVNYTMPVLFADAIKGKYDEEERWITREEFHEKKKSDGYIASCWSYSGDTQTYIYGKNIEEYSEARHRAVFFKDYTLSEKYGLDFEFMSEYDTPKERYIAMRRHLKKLYYDENRTEGNGKFNDLVSRYSQRTIESLTAYQNLLRLQNLRNLEPLMNKLEISGKDYRDVKVKDNAVVYCDIPYKSCCDYYGIKFDFESFYNWARNAKFPLFISEYGMPDDFVCIKEIPKRQLISQKVRKVVKEKIFVPPKSEYLTRRL